MQPFKLVKQALHAPQPAICAASLCTGHSAPPCAPWLCTVCLLASYNLKCCRRPRGRPERQQGPGRGGADQRTAQQPGQDDSASAAAAVAAALQPPVRAAPHGYNVRG